MRIQEISLMRGSDFEGGRSHLGTHYNVGNKEYDDLDKSGKLKKLPGNNQYTYSVIERGLATEIVILDPGRKGKFTNLVIAALDVGLPSRSPIDNVVEVGTITVDEKYRGQNLAKALYGIVLLPPPVGLGKILFSGTDQTPGGQRNWVSLSKIPGVEITGYLAFYNEESRRAGGGDDVAALEELLGKVGGVYMGETKFQIWYEVPVQLVTTPQKLKQYLDVAPKTKRLSIYGDTFLKGRYSSGLMAKYVG
jgi:hypothetical protein